MAYKDRFGITSIEQSDKSVDTFDISWDIDGDDESDKAQRYPVFLITPDKKEFDHHHVSLSRKGAKDLRDWLAEFLDDTPEPRRRGEEGQ